MSDGSARVSWARRLVLGAAAAAALAAPAPAAAYTFLVAKTIPEGAEYSCRPVHGSWCRTIAEAVQATARNRGPDYISVSPGTYRENVVVAAGNEVTIDGFGAARIVAARQSTFAVRMHTGKLLRMTVVNAGTGYAPAVGLAGSGSDRNTWPVLEQVSIASPRATGGALHVSGTARVFDSTIVASSRGSAAAVRVTSTGSTGSEYVLFSGCTISGARALWLEPDDGRTLRRVSGWWNTIRGSVLQQSGEVRLLESLLDGTLNARTPAYQIRPRRRLGARTDIGYVAIAQLDSVTMVARGAPPLDVAVAPGPGNDQAEVLLENALLWRPDRGPVVTLDASDFGRSVRLTLQNVLFAGPSAGLEGSDNPRVRVALDELYNTRGAPVFVDPDRGNFRLRPGSLAIDRGQPGPVAAGEPSADLDGNPRVQGAARDLGAYEFTP